MTLIQQIGVAGMNWLIGRTNDTFQGQRRQPGGLCTGHVDLLELGFLALFFAVMLRKEETGPNAHGLETITTSSAA